MDARVSPGATLHALDLLRAQDWQKEIVLLCDKSWEPYITVEQPAIFLDRKIFFHQTSLSEDQIVNTQALEDFLTQLDSFDIKNVLQLGELSWGRWIKTYITEVAPEAYEHIGFDSNKVSAIEVTNIISDQLNLDLHSTQKNESRNSLIYIDPYVNGSISEDFKKMLEGSVEQFPAWANIIANEDDQIFFTQLGLEENVIDPDEMNINLFNQFVLCFDENSVLAQTSRSYNVALYTSDSSANSCAYVPGDIVIHSEELIHISELSNILSYWKRSRLKELAFQWINMDVDIEVVELFHHRIVKRKIQSYASDLLHCQHILNKFDSIGSKISNRDISDFVRYMRTQNNNDPYALSFSLKILIMITERMLASSTCGERIFQRLGSDYHRIVIGEALIDGIFKKSKVDFEKIDLAAQLKDFQNFLYKIDYYNDYSEAELSGKES